MYEIQQDVSVTRINLADKTYQVSSPCDSLHLTGSLEAIGLINPPILLQDGKKFKIISGFRRIMAIRQLGWPELSARILTDQASHLTCVQIAIAENSYLRDLDLVEQARALQLLKSCIPDQGDLIASAMKLGLPLNPSLIEKLDMVNGMNSVLRHGLTIGAIALPAALKLYHWDDHDAARQMGQLLIELNMSLNRQREMIEWIEGILARESIKSNNILESLGIDKILENRNYDRRQKTDTIRSLLKKRRYPAIADMEIRYHAMTKKITLPAGCQLLPPSFFEGTVFSVTIEFSTLSQLNERLDGLKRMSQEKELQRLLSFATFDQ